MALNEVKELLASAARTASGNGDAVVLLDPTLNLSAQAYIFWLEVTAAATDSGDHLDVYIQTTFDDSTWVDVLHFTQLDGNTSVTTPKRYVAKLIPNAAEAEFENASALAEATARDIISGGKVRVRYAITDAGTDNASFTFSVRGVAL